MTISIFVVYLEQCLAAWEDDHDVEARDLYDRILTGGTQELEEFLLKREARIKREKLAAPVKATPIKQSPIGVDASGQGKLF